MYINNIKKDITKNIDFDLLKKTIITTFVLGFIAHSYIFYNSISSHDSLFFMNGVNSNWYISSGRFIRPIIINIKGNWAIPLVNGLLSLFFISISSYLIIKILDINNRFSQFLVCCILTTNASFTLLTASYLDNIDMDMFALLLSLLAMYLLSYKKMDIKNVGISIILIITSLGIYQTYINVILTLALILLIKNLLNKKELKNELYDLVKKYLVIFCSAILYYFIAMEVKKFFNVYGYIDYNSIDGSLTKSIISYLKGISLAIYAVYDFMLMPNSNNVVLIKVVNILIAFISLYELIVLIIKNKIGKNTLIIIFSLILLPIISNATTIVSGFYHDLTTYGMYMFYILSIVVNDLMLENKYYTLNNLVKILLIIFTIDSCLFSNKVYLNKDLESKSTLSICTRIIDRIEQVDGYIPGKTPVALIGELKGTQLDIKRKDMFYDGTGLASDYSISYFETYDKYFKDYLGYKINLLDYDSANLYLNNKEVQEMDYFPSINSVKMIDNIVVVKISDDK